MSNQNGSGIGSGNQVVDQWNADSLTAKCAEKKCKLTILHWHCGYCKEVIANWWNRSRKNCNACAGEKTAKTKLYSVRNTIKTMILEYYQTEEKLGAINVLKSNTGHILSCSKHFYGSCKDIEMIIDNYFDSSKPLPLISVNNHPLIDLNNTRKRKDFDDTNNTYLDLIRRYNRENIYVNCPYQDKDECKHLGGKWDNDKKLWYIPVGIDSAKFKKWL